MFIYNYDGSFDGLICVLKEASEQKIELIENIISSEKGTDSLFSQIININNHAQTADSYFNWIKNHYSFKIWRLIVLAFLSEMDGFEMLIFQFLNLLKNYGENIIRNHSNETIFKLRQICQKVTLESHRLKGLARFRKLDDGVFYSSIEPTHNVLSLLARHFVMRYKKQKWMVHDVKRNNAIIYDGKNYKIGTIDELNLEVLSSIDRPDSGYLDPDEKLYQDLWKTYFKTIAVAERKNPRQQRQYMPKRYWKYLIEIK